MILCPIPAPVRITQHFGARPSTYARFGLSGHSGVDFTYADKSYQGPVHSPYDALVWDTGYEPGGYGKYVLLLTDAGGDGLRREVVLSHLRRIDVEKGQRVYMGDPVGLLGNTGFSDAPHLHLGLRRRNDTFQVEDYNNGYHGFIDFEEYLLFWHDPDDIEGLVSYPYG